MSGTDRSLRTPITQLGPVIVLVEPQLGENIGAAARAMANFGLSDLRLVAPRDGWPNPKAMAAASGAGDVLSATQVFGDERAAVGDCRRIYATSARPRELVKHVLRPDQAAAEIAEFSKLGVRAAILYGGDRAGLTNDQISFADTIISVPAYPGFGSLNLAQAVLIMGYELYRAGHTVAPIDLPMGQNAPAEREEIYQLFEHLEHELDEAGFLFPPHKRQHMVRNIRTMLLRAGMTDQDVRIWRGIVKALANGPKRKW